MAPSPGSRSATGPTPSWLFGIDLDAWKPGQEALFDGSVPGYPLDSLMEVPAGTYTVQALLHEYETFTRADGHTVKLPMDRGEGQQWARAPGNLYSTPRKVAFDPKGGETIRVALDKVIPPIPDPPETKYIKHVRIQSERLTKFWGRPMYLGAHVLLPAGWELLSNSLTKRMSMKSSGLLLAASEEKRGQATFPILLKNPVDFSF